MGNQTSSLPDLSAEEQAEARLRFKKRLADAYGIQVRRGLKGGVPRR